MKKKKVKKWAKKLKKYCHRTPCSECALYKDRCRISNYPAPAYWGVKKKPEGTIHKNVSELYEQGKSLDEIALTLNIAVQEVRNCMMDIGKARKAAGIK